MVNSFQQESRHGTIEIQETLTPAEKKFELLRQRIGLLLGPLVLIGLLLKSIPGLEPKAHTLAAIIGFVVVYWITEAIPIPVTALLAAVLCVVFGVADAKPVFAPFADPAIFLFIGSFVMAEAMIVHRLDKRFAYRIMSFSWVGDSTARLLFIYGAIAAFISMWVSNTATTAMMFPIGLGLISTLSDITGKQPGERMESRTSRYGVGMMLMASYAASAGGIGTPVGTPPNLIGIAMIEKYAQVKIPFFQWMTFAVPLLVVMYGVLFTILYWLHKPEVKHVEGSHAFVLRELNEMGSWTAGQRNTMIAFFVMVVLWIVPGILAVFIGVDAPVYKAYNKMIPESVAALIGAVLLFLMPVNWKKREFTLHWPQAVRIDWGTLLLFGGGLTLGNLMFETKLAEFVGRELLNFSHASSSWGITFAAIFIAILVSETTSNTASANMVVPVMISLCQAAGVNPIPPAIGATIAASWGFMLPVSTPPNAIVYGSGLIPILKMIRAGFLFDILGGLLIWVGLRILLPIAGLA